VDVWLDWTIVLREKQSRVGKVEWVMEFVLLEDGSRFHHLGNMEPLAHSEKQHNLLRKSCWKGLLGEDRGREASQKAVAITSLRNPRLVLLSYHGECNCSSH
jgi:hypothetical protein